VGHVRPEHVDGFAPYSVAEHAELKSVPSHIPSNKDDVDPLVPE